MEEVINDDPYFRVIYRIEELLESSNIPKNKYLITKLDEPGRIRLQIATSRNNYSIDALESKSGGYLGCIASSRLIRPGESWIRGNDLPDGKFNISTWRRIMAGIIKYELVPMPEKQTIAYAEESDFVSMVEQPPPFQSVEG